MGCWGVSTFESDDGLDCVALIQFRLPDNGKLELGTLITDIHEDVEQALFYLPFSSKGQSHTYPMALAEVILKFLNQEQGEMGVVDKDIKRFDDVVSFTATKDSVQWVRDYLAETLSHAKANAIARSDWNGWVSEESWIEWQKHISMLIQAMDKLLDSPADTIVLYEESGLTQLMKAANRLERNSNYRFHAGPTIENESDTLLRLRMKPKLQEGVYRISFDVKLDADPRCCHDANSLQQLHSDMKKLLPQLRFLEAREIILTTDEFAEFQAFLQVREMEQDMKPDHLQGMEH